MSALLSVSDVSRSHGGMPVLRHTSLDLSAGELVALTGPSGSGKSTLLMIAGGWDRPDSGTVEVRPPMPELPVSEQPWHALAFVPQSISLFEELTVAENLAFAARTAAEPPDHRKLLETLDLAKLADRLPSEISRGEQQRAAVARVLASGPLVLLADEPTSHQDRAHAEMVLTALRRAADRGTAVLVASHDPLLSEHADRVVPIGGA
ncbi:ABC transporter ATP-binding protein [Amycolatopsis benzoatilytica]|uniref:ABC transporter ATP-binding protein n=1 Tax=Amycolatopsis benzoatilytica TaxID=346045 RepID=UPI00037AF484|nr:ABC transporter ATP-binding protein [Amycolatopsis benzoatilytica]